MGALITVETRKIKDKYYTMLFGKHVFRSIKWILKHDPRYIRWLHENEVMRFSKKILNKTPNLYEQDDNDDSGDWYGF